MELSRTKRLRRAATSLINLQQHVYSPKHSSHISHGNDEENLVDNQDIDHFCYSQDPFVPLRSDTERRT